MPKSHGFVDWFWYGEPRTNSTCRMCCWLLQLQCAQADGTLDTPLKPWMVPKLVAPMFWPRTALAIMLRGDSVNGWLAHFGLKCSSWTAVNSGTSGRSPCTAIGNTDYKSVRDGNCLGSRSFVSIDCVILCCNCSCQVPWTCAYFWESPINEQLTCSQDDLTHDGSSVSQCLYPIGATFLQLLWVLPTL